MNIPDCYDPIYQAERREAEADSNALHCEDCHRAIYDEVWDIEGQLLCDRCAARMYRKNVEDIIF